MHTCIRQVCCLRLAPFAMSTRIRGGSTRFKKIKVSGWQQQFYKAKLYKRSRG